MRGYLYAHPLSTKTLIWCLCLMHACIRTTLFVAADCPISSIPFPPPSPSSPFPFKRKCDQYWADDIGQDFVTASFTVTTTATDSFSDFVVRTFTLKHVRVLCLQIYCISSIVLPVHLLVYCKQHPDALLTCPVSHRVVPLGDSVQAKRFSCCSNEGT